MGKTDKKCEKCGGFYSQMIRFWIEFLRRSLSVKREKVEKLLADPYARRAIINITKSFIYYGIKKPLSIYAPFLVVWDFTHKSASTQFFKPITAFSNAPGTPLNASCV